MTMPWTITKKSVDEIKRSLTSLCISGIDEGERNCETLAIYGAREIMLLGDQDDHRRKYKVLTHGNTGSLANVGHGTALGVIKELDKLGKLEMAYCTEARPSNQGSRLIAWELRYEYIPSTLIADSMVAYLMQTKKLDAVVVGADRISGNGDTINEIGTLQIAVLAKHYGVPFYVAAPAHSVEINSPGYREITEERPADELRHLGPVQLAPLDIRVWNPCFDVTPANLITGFITPIEVVPPNRLRAFWKDPNNYDLKSLLMAMMLLKKMVIMTIFLLIGPFIGTRCGDFHFLHHLDQIELFKSHSQ